MLLLSSRFQIISGETVAKLSSGSCPESTKERTENFLWGGEQCVYIRITSCWIHAPGRLCALVVFKKLSRVEFKKIYIKDPTLLQLSGSFFFQNGPRIN